MVGGQYQIAFVLTVLFVDQNHHAARRQLSHQLGNGGNIHHQIVGGQGLRPCRLQGSGGPVQAGGFTTPASLEPTGWPLVWAQRHSPSTSCWCGPKPAL